MTNTICDKTIEQPSSETVKQNILYTPGPVVSYRAFKHGKRSLRSIAETEYQRAAKSLQDDGFRRIVEFRVPRARAACKVFIKLRPDPYPTSAPLSSAQRHRSTNGWLSPKQWLSIKALLTILPTSLAFWLLKIVVLPHCYKQSFMLNARSLLCHKIKFLFSRVH